MMRRRHASNSKSGSSVIDEALDALGAPELRKLVRDIMPWLEEQTHARLISELIDRAAGTGSGWNPAEPSDADIAEIVAFAEAAKRVGHADPSEVDDYLRQGSNAFLCRDYGTALQIFRALIVPIGEVEIDLGQHEMVEEVLGVDVATCAAQYVVATYMTDVPEHRAKSVLSAIEDVCAVSCIWEPLREMERVAVEPLPGLDDFLPRWRALMERSAGGGRSSDWDTDEDRWLREVVLRIEGVDGLARVARSTMRADDLRAWCGALSEAGNWKAAFSANEEAAEIVTDKNYSRGEFLDGAALAAQELGRRDLPTRLERAWRLAPSMLRLRRWLGSSGSRAVLKKRAAEAIKICPKKARRQQAFLHVLAGDLNPAAKLLASAPGLGWSNEEHPGHLLFSLFCGLLGDKAPSLGQDAGLLPGWRMDFDELELLSTDCDEPCLANPHIDEIIETAGIHGVASVRERAAVIKAMRRAAEKRIAGVTQNKRRRHYGHAASLAAACVAIDPTPETTAWMAEIRDEYRRYPALQRELKRYEGSV